MGEINRVVARFLDGRVLKGTTEDFLPNRPKFHLHPLGNAPPEVVACRDLKAVFFVRDFSGDAARKDMKGFGHLPVEANQGKKISVVFKDGEVISGYTLAYSREREGFFVVPADPGSNNIRIYVLRGAAQKVLVGPQADEFFRRNADAA
ncbi:MAG: DUF6982 domain-containing protein [Candidatus Eisenbacteria bacterium]